jgi:hypothetical protein
VNFLYFAAWSGHVRRPQSLLSITEAAQKHARGDEYVVVVGSPEKPDIYMDIVLKRNYISVVSLDEQLRQYNHIAFVRVTNGSFATSLLPVHGRFLLKEIAHRRYIGDTDKPSYAMFMYFNTDGTVRVKESFVDRGTQREGTGKYDVNVFYVDPPEFGHYKEFLKFGKGGGFDPGSAIET